MRAALFVMLLAACTPVPLDAPDAGSCDPGESRGCFCMGTGGQQTCVSAGVWSACGCASATGPDVTVPPAPPPPQSCGLNVCKPYVEEDSEVGAKGCCTSNGQCGSSSEFLFGKQCIPRGLPPGVKRAECPDESVNFADFDGCCRSDGKCGLSIDFVPNFDLGCLERTAMQKLVNDGSEKRNLLSTFFFLGIKQASFPAKSCTP